jgi:uncharacterized protein YbjT (DUF2867 family)
MAAASRLANTARINNQLSPGQRRKLVIMTTYGRRGRGQRRIVSLSATGYAGQRALRELLARGQEPTLAGRNRTKILALADRLVADVAASVGKPALMLRVVPDPAHVFRPSRRQFDEIVRVGARRMLAAPVESASTATRSAHLDR